jgi:hypothetical protein
MLTKSCRLSGLRLTKGGGRLLSAKGWQGQEGSKVSTVCL